MSKVSPFPLLSVVSCRIDQDLQKLLIWSTSVLCQHVLQLLVSISTVCFYCNARIFLVHWFSPYSGLRFSFNSATVNWQMKWCWSLCGGMPIVSLCTQEYSVLVRHLLIGLNLLKSILNHSAFDAAYKTVKWTDVTSPRWFPHTPVLTFHLIFVKEADSKCLQFCCLRDWKYMSL